MGDLRSKERATDLSNPKETVEHTSGVVVNLVLLVWELLPSLSNHLWKGWHDEEGISKTLDCLPNCHEND